MPEYRRGRQVGGTYFFTVVTHERRPFLTDEPARGCLRSARREARGRRPFHVDAVCLLPDHLHTVCTLPEGDSDFSGRWAAIKSVFSKRYLAGGGSEGARSASRARQGEAALWQRRFWEHVIRDEEDYRRHPGYVHYNPVKHALVQRAGDWPWSSLQRLIAEGLYPAGWGETEPPLLRGATVVGESGLPAG